jgi:membrane protein
MLVNLEVPVGWGEIVKRTGRALLKDDITGWAAELAYYFFLALFPALLFLVALASYFPLQNLVSQMVSYLAGVVPPDVLGLMTGQLTTIANRHNGGLLTIGIVAAIWSASSGMSAIIDTLNQVYDIQEGVFVVLSFVLVLVGPMLGQAAAYWLHLGRAFEIAWRIAHWPIVLFLLVLAVGITYHYAPDAEQEWVLITPGSILATILWVLGSLGFRFYVAYFGSFNATYGAIGGVIVALLWFYIAGLSILIGAEMNAEIEHASPYSEEPGQKRIGEKKKIGLAAARAYERRRRGQADPGTAARPRS